MQGNLALVAKGVNQNVGGHWDAVIRLKGVLASHKGDPVLLSAGVSEACD